MGSGAPVWQASGSSAGPLSGELRHVAPSSGAPAGAARLRAAVIAANRFAMIGADGARRASLIGAIDTTGDRYADAAAVDTTGDGVADARGYDTAATAWSTRRRRATGGSTRRSSRCARARAESARRGRASEREAARACE